MRPLLLPVLALALTACRTTYRPPDLGQLYDRVAQTHTGERNPVIVIPGILGSNLVDRQTGTTVWGAFGGDYADPRTGKGARLIALPMQEGLPLALLRDSVEQNGALESINLRIFGLPIGVNAYFNILLALGAIGGYRDQQLAQAEAVDYGNDHFTCFQFAYDWRRDVSEIAGAFHAFLLEREAYVRAEYERRGIEMDEIRFDIVAHSMGGLVLRYFLRYGAEPLPDDGSLPELTWEGAEHIERAVLIGPPNAGSIQAFADLRQGTKIGPFTPRYRAGILGTMPAVYQLLPRERHGAWTTPDGDRLADPLAVETWDAFGWGLLDPDEDECLAQILPGESADRRRAIARDHVDKCLTRARQLAAALDIPASPPAGTELFLAAGDATDTPARVEIDPETGSTRDRPASPGDGTVLRSSALMDERIGNEWQPVLVSPIHWERVMFFFEDHLGLTKAPAFIDNLLYLLLEEPRD